MKSYTIHLLRHGMTLGNQLGQYVGSTDVDLSTDGINQLKNLKQKYDYGNPQLIFSSPLKRCKQTLEILFGDREVITVEGLRECNMGDFEGKTTKELVDDPRFMDWVQHGAAPPNGEDNKTFSTRICTAFVETVRDILKAGKKESVICAHGGVIMTLLAVYGLPQTDRMNWMANNGMGFTIRVTPSVWMRTGMVEVVCEYPFGSAAEPDLSQNPAKQTAAQTGQTVFGAQDDAQDVPEDEDFEEADTVFWADVDDDDGKEK